MCGEFTLRVGRVICINRRELCALSFLKFSHFIWMPEILCGCAECVHQAVKVTVTEKVPGRAQQTGCTWQPKLQTL